MANRVKEDEKNERIIRNLLKLAENRRCINCNSLGPQYVCTNFWTFVCTTCSRIHREFTHRVKSVSMAKFSSQEVSALQGGGNARAKEVYFKEWDPQRQSVPDTSNVERLCDFIKHVYVDRRYAGERSFDKPPRTKMRTASSSSLASSNGNPSEFRRESSGILIDLDAVPEPFPTAVVPQIQQTAVGQSILPSSTSSNADNWACFDSAPEVNMSQAPANANSLESVLSQLSVPASVPAQSAGIVGTGVVPETAPVANMSALPSSSNSLGAPVGQMSSLPFVNNAPTAFPVNNLTISPPVSGSVASPVGPISMSPFGIGASVTLPSGGAPVGAPGSTPVLPSNGAGSFVQVADGGQWPNMLPLQPSLFPAAVGQTTAQPFTLPVSGSSGNLPWNVSIASNTQGPSSIPAVQTSQALSKPIPEVTSGAITQSSSVEAKPSGRTALPEDLFTATYPSSMMVPGWQTGLPYGYGFNMQYNTAAPMQTYLQPSKSSNPFDLNNEISPVQAPMFPSMASLQGGLPNMAAPAGLLRTSGLGTPSPSRMPSQSSYPSSMPTQAPTFVSVLPPSAYMGQQISSNLPPRQQGVVGFSAEGTTFGSLIPNQHPSRMYSAPATPNTFSAVGGNPFG